MDQQPAVINNTAAHRFEIRVGDDLAFAEYVLDGGRIVFTHTLVPEALGGQGLAGRLAKAGLDYAASQELKVVPRCSYIAGYIGKHPEYAPLVEGGRDTA
jgi:uncharacterized protein